MRYVTTAYLSDLVRKNLSKIPHDIDLVVGVPRSGMLPATMIALALNKRLTDINSFAEGRAEWENGADFKKVIAMADSYMYINKEQRKSQMEQAEAEKRTS